MARTLLDICQEFAERAGLPAPARIVGGNPMERQYLRLVQETARDMQRRHDWQVCERVATFTSTAVELQRVMTAAWPNFRRIKPETFINITKGRRIIPIDSRQHSTIALRGLTIDGVYYRIRGNELLFPGNTTAGDSCQFEYVTHEWVTSADGTTYRTRPTADTDWLLLDDEGLLLGLKWRWKKENGQAYGEDFTDYEKLLQELQGSEREQRTLSITPVASGGLIAPEIVDAGYTADTAMLTADSALYLGDLG